MHMGITAETWLERYKISRAMQDQLVAVRASVARLPPLLPYYSKEQIVPVEITRGKGTVLFDTDEHVRSTTVDVLA